MPIEDPEFPFDLKSLNMRATLPTGYPTDAIAGIEVLNEDIPEAVRRRIRNRMEEAAEKAKSGEPNVKDLLRILDRNLEKWMIALPTIGGSTTGIKIIPASSIVVTPSEHSSSDRMSSSASDNARNFDADQVSKTLEMLKVRVPMKKEMASLGRFQPPEHIKLDPISSSRVAGTIQMDLPNLTFENIGLMIPVQLGLSVGCGRCRATTAINDLRPDTDRIVPCTGCKQHMELHDIREAIHANNQKLGYLRTKRCYPSDLLPTCFQITCDHCTPTDPLASSIKVDGVQIGETLAFPCRNCHHQCVLLIEGILWTQIPSLAPGKSADTLKVAKLPTKIGEPLPEFGTCSHYRKSHRWFRFPCCGRAYPCDECHDADSTSKVHAVEWASRQICGYCSREFSIAQKYCECGEMPAAAAKHTAHWEGGKGTRDQLIMSRKDKKKYRNQEKTISQKAKAQK